MGELCKKVIESILESGRYEKGDGVWRGEGGFSRHQRICVWT
jgi:hypothetical protein